MIGRYSFDVFKRDDLHVNITSRWTLSSFDMLNFLYTVLYSLRISLSTASTDFYDVKAIFLFGWGPLLPPIQICILYNKNWVDSEGPMYSVVSKIPRETVSLAKLAS